MNLYMLNVKSFTIRFAFQWGSLGTVLIKNKKIIFFWFLTFWVLRSYGVTPLAVCYCIINFSTVHTKHCFSLFSAFHMDCGFQYWWTSLFTDSVFAVSLIRDWTFDPKPQYSRIFPPFNSLIHDFFQKSQNFGKNKS